MSKNILDMTEKEIAKEQIKRARKKCNYCTPGMLCPYHGDWYKNEEVLQS